MSTPDAGALPPMKPSALPETLSTTEIADALDTCPTHELSMYVAIAIDRLRALAAATEEKDKEIAQLKGMSTWAHTCVHHTDAERRTGNTCPVCCRSKLTELERENRELRERDSRDGVGLIAKERARQIAKEGWSETHDDQHNDEELAIAAACYALPHICRVRGENVAPRLNQQTWRTLVDQLWPWSQKWWKPTPTDRVRELVKAGALIAAEIDRLNRDAARTGGAT